jgi:hypothetical protein
MLTLIKIYFVSSELVLNHQSTETGLPLNHKIKENCQTYRNTVYLSFTINQMIIKRL